MASRRRGPLTGTTIACEDRDFTEWHGGVSHALAWVVMLDSTDITRLVAAARRRLAGFLLPRYLRQPHVTLTYAGLADGDAPARLRQQAHVIADVLDGPLGLDAVGWGTFPMVPHLEVDCPGLVAAHRVLTADAPDEHQMDYLPHVTLGHYAGTWPLAEPLHHLAGLPATGRWEVQHLSLVRLETRDIAGPLEVVGRLRLDSGEWVPVPGLTPTLPPG